MRMTTIDYNAIRFNLTEAIRHLEFLKSAMTSKHREDKYTSEVDYWLSSLDLIRNCLYGCTDKYDGQIDIKDAIREIKCEITNFIVIIKDFKIRELQELDAIWVLLVKIEKLLEN